jgi:hypothetical protein
MTTPLKTPKTIDIDLQRLRFWLVVGASLRNWYPLQNPTTWCDSVIPLDKEAIINHGLERWGGRLTDLRTYRNKKKRYVFLATIYIYQCRGDVKMNTNPMPLEVSLTLETGIIYYRLGKICHREGFCLKLP